MNHDTSCAELMAPVIDGLKRENAALKAALRINALRNGFSHSEVDLVIDNIVGAVRLPPHHKLANWPETPPIDKSSEPAP